MEKNYTKFAVKGTATILGISLIAAFLGYLVRLILARNLTIEEFGLFYAVFAFLAFLTIFKTFGFDRSLIKFIPEFHHNNRNDFIKSSMIYVSTLLLITNTVVIILVYLLANYLSIHFFHDPRAGIILKLMAIAFFAETFVVVIKYSFQGFQKMALFSVMDAVRMLLILIIISIGFKMNYGLFSPVAAYIIIPFILLFAFGFILFENVFPKFSESKFVIDKGLLKKISKFSAFIMLASPGGMILGYTDSILLTFFSGLTAVGLYNIALPTSKILLYFPNAFGNVLLPLTSELWTKKKEVLLKAGIESLYKYSMIITIPLAFIMFSFADLGIIVLFGKKYILAKTTMQILTIGMIFATIHAVHSNFFQGIGKPQIHSKIIYTAAIFNLVGNLILIPRLGIIGAAITTSASYMIMMLVGLVKISKFVKIQFPVQTWIKTLFAGLIFTITISFLKKIIFLNVWLEIVIVLVLSGVIYIALLFLLRIIDTNELRDLYRRIVK